MSYSPLSRTLPDAPVPTNRTLTLLLGDAAHPDAKQVVLG